VTVVDLVAHWFQKWKEVRTDDEEISPLPCK